MYKIILSSILLMTFSTLSLADESPQKTEVITAKQVEWLRKPSLKNSELYRFPVGNYQLIVRMDIDSTGIIKHAYIRKSSGLSQLDQYVLTQVKKAKFKPYSENSIAYDFNIDQPFNVIIPEIKEKSLWKKLFWY